MSYKPPWLTVVCTTIGRPSLGRLLESIPSHNGIEVIVVADTYANDEADFTKEISTTQQLYEKNVRWVNYDAGHHNWGHPQRNLGDSLAQGEWIIHSQDDNQFHPSAFTDIWFAVCGQTEPRPILFKVHTWQAGTVWRAPYLVEGNVDADCIVVPNNSEKLGRWGNTYQGDFAFISETVALYGGTVDWNPQLIQWHSGKDDYRIPSFHAGT